MSNQKSTEGHWETQSASSKTVKIGNNPACISGHEASAEGTFDHGRPVVIDSQAASFDNQRDPNRIEFKDESVNQQRSIK